MLRGFKKNLNSLSNKTDALSAISKFINGELDVTDEIADASTVLTAAKQFMLFIDGRIADYEERARAEGNSDYAEVVAELNRRNEERDEPAYIKEWLPAPFAIDLTY